MATSKKKERKICRIIWHDKGGKPYCYYRHEDRPGHPIRDIWVSAVSSASRFTPTDAKKHIKKLKNEHDLKAVKVVLIR